MLNFSKTDCLWYDREAAYFEEALPIGNGTVGAMVYGGAACARIGLNHDTFWTGGPTDALEKSDKAAYFKAQALAMDGKYGEAQRVLANEFCICARVAAYQPIGDLLLECNVENVKNYRRALHLREALATEAFDADGVHFTRESFVSYPDRCICWRITASRACDFTLSMTSPLSVGLEEYDNGIAICGEAPIDSPVQIQRKATDTALIGKHGMRSCARAAIECDGTLLIESGRVRVSGARNVFICVAVTTSFAGFDKDPAIEGGDERADASRILEEALKRGYEALREAHVADVSGFYDRVQFTLDGNEGYDLPTDERRMRFVEDRGAHDKALYVLNFNYGRYLTIAGSRDGSRALNLQGIWNDKLDPPWSSNYTTNINLQMNYFPTLAVNLPEMTEPLDTLIKNVSVNGRKTAERLYGARGFVCHHNTDVWAHTVPIKGEPLYSFWPFGSGWMCHHLFEKYEYTLDRDYLASVYPIMCEAARFYLDILTDLDGYRAICPATSPENFFIFEGERVAVAKSTAMSMAIVRELFENCLAAAKVLDDHAAILDEIAQELPRLLPTRLLSDGRIEEWYFGEGVEYPENEPDHRHTSQLYALHPSHAINASTPALEEGARRTLKARGEEGTGWALSWRACFYARLRDGDHALSLLDRMLLPMAPETELRYGWGGGAYPNLFSAHPPFQIDGNFGYVGAICEMLVQSDAKEIRTLPALPSAWKNGEIRGLRVKGNKFVDIFWQDGQLLEMKEYQA